MDFVFIDYSRQYHSAAGTRPPGSCCGKFVRLRRGGKEYLVFSPRELDAYHAGIVERFCRQEAIEGEYDGLHKRFDIRDPEWEILGGGKYEINSREKFVRLYDDSMAYGKFGLEGLKEEVSGIAEFAGYEVRLE